MVSVCVFLCVCDFRIMWLSRALLFEKPIPTQKYWFVNRLWAELGFWMNRFFLTPLQHTQLTMFIISLSFSDQNKVLYGGLRAHNRWMPIMLMKYCRNIVTHAICCDKKGTYTLWVKICLCKREAGPSPVCVLQRNSPYSVIMTDKDICVLKQNRES